MPSLNRFVKLFLLITRVKQSEAVKTTNILKEHSKFPVHYIVINQNNVVILTFNRLFITFKWVDNTFLQHFYYVFH
jgi:hypothetical protein